MNDHHLHGVPPEDPVLVWGAGAIGGAMAAYWARAGVPVHLVDLEAEHIRVCADGGLHIHGPIETFTQRIPGSTPTTLRGQYSRIVLAVKAQATEEAARAIAPHLRDDGFVVSAQNGLNEVTLSRMLGEQRVMGCFVNFGADWHGPGNILHGNRGAVVVGEIDGSVRERTRHVHALLRLFEPEAVLTDNIWGYLWGKLAYGSMLVATALTPDSMTENFADPDRFAAFHALGREVMAVALARGVHPVGFDGFDPAAFYPGAGLEPAQSSIASLAAFNARTTKTHSGVWRDLAVRRRKTEVAAQYGVITALGREVGVPTPVLSRLIELITDIEQGHRVQSRETLALLIASAPEAGASPAPGRHPP